jgi:hypothetical protein
VLVSLELCGRFVGLNDLDVRILLGERLLVRDILALVELAFVYNLSDSLEGRIIFSIVYVFQAWLFLLRALHEVILDHWQVIMHGSSRRDTLVSRLLGH